MSKEIAEKASEHPGVIVSLTEDKFYVVSVLPGFCSDKWGKGIHAGLSTSNRKSLMNFVKSVKPCYCSSCRHRMIQKGLRGELKSDESTKLWIDGLPK